MIDTGPATTHHEPNELGTAADFRLLVDSVQDYAIWMMDPTGIIKTWNQGAERLKGYTAAEIIGSHFSRFYQQQEIDAGKCAFELEVAAATGRYEEEGWRVKKDGSLFWASIVITALRDPKGRLVGYGKVTRDLTERRRSEEDLRKSEERLRLMIDGVNDYAILSLDPEGRVATWNQGVKRLKGYDENDLVGRHFSVFYPKEDIERGKPEMELREATAHGSFEDEGWRLKKDGTPFWANVILTAMRDRDGVLRGFSKVTRDLTVRKAHEDEMRRKSVALAASNTELEAFCYSVSHDLRAPLRGIDGFSQALVEDYHDALDETGRRYLTFVREGTQKMGRLIDDLLNLSRVTRLELKTGVVDISRLAHEICERLRTQDPKRSVVCKIQDGLEVNGDEGLLNAALENLLSNAWKFTAKVAHAEIFVGVESRDGVPTYFVRDNGAGFNMKYYDKLFGAFQRLHTDVEFKGTGVGLATVRRILSRHGGRIWAESEVGIGTTFYFTL